MTAKKQAFNLAALDTVAACNKPFEVQIKDVHGNPTPFFISVLGKDSDVYRTFVDSLADERIKRQATGKADEVSLTKIQSTNIEGLVIVTKGWRVADSNTITLGDEELDCTPANVRKVYERLIPVREQVAEAVNDLANFMPAS